MIFRMFLHLNTVNKQFIWLRSTEKSGLTKFSSFSNTCSSFGITSPAIFGIDNTSSDSHSSESESEASCLNFLPSGERLSSVEDAVELFLDFRLTVSAIQHCQARSKIAHVYSDILPDPVSQLCKHRFHYQCGIFVVGGKTSLLAKLP